MIQGINFERAWSITAILRTCPFGKVENARARKPLNLTTIENGGTSIGIASVTKGTTTLVTLDSAYTGFGGALDNDVDAIYMICPEIADLHQKVFRTKNRTGNDVELWYLNGFEVDSTSMSGTYTTGGSLNDTTVTALGYMPSVYGASLGFRISNCYGMSGRHAGAGGTTDGRGATYSATTNRHLQGQPTHIIRENNTSFGANGPPDDDHEEGYNIITTNSNILYPTRGVQGGTYPPIGIQSRCLKSLHENCRVFGGAIGIRVAAVEHSIVPLHTYNNMYFEKQQGGNSANDGSALTIRNQSGVTNAAIVTGDNWNIVDPEYVYRFEASSIARFGTHKAKMSNASRVISIEGADCTLSWDKLTIDVRDDTGTAPALIDLEDDGANPYTGNSLYIGEVEILVGASTTLPTNLFSINGTASGNAINISVGKISIYNPAGATLPNVGSSGDIDAITFDIQNCDYIHIPVNSPQTTLTTAMKGSFILPKNFIVAGNQAFRANVNTVSSSGAVTFDINNGGTSIFATNKLSIDATETTSDTAGTIPSISTAAVATLNKGDILTVDVDGAGTGATGGEVYIFGWFV